MFAEISVLFWWFDSFSGNEQCIIKITFIMRVHLGCSGRYTVAYSR